MKILDNIWVRIVISAISFAAIIGINQVIQAPLFTWSVAAIEKVEQNQSNALKYTCYVLSWSSWNSPNVLVICIFTAMFKRRKQAFSYLLLWFAQVFLNAFLKLALRQGRPSMVTKESWTSYDQVISLGSPAGAALTAMCISLSLVLEYIYHTEETNELDLDVGRSLSNENIIMSL